MLVPQSLMLMLCAFIFGSLNGVSFQDAKDRRRIYSFYSYSWPGTPFIHQMIIHRAMMSIISYALACYSLSLLPQDIAIPALMLMPFIVALAAQLLMKEEVINTTQFVFVSLSFFGVLLFTYPNLLETRIDSEQVMAIARYVQPHMLPLMTLLLSSGFGAMKFLATRRIGKQVHPSSKTMYLGLCTLILSVFMLLIFNTDYFMIWKANYTPKQVGMLVVDGFFCWLTQFALSISLENFRAVNFAACFSVSIVVAQFLGNQFEITSTYEFKQKGHAIFLA